MCPKWFKNNKFRLVRKQTPQELMKNFVLHKILTTCILNHLKHNNYLNTCRSGEYKFGTEADLPCS